MIQKVPVNSVNATHTDRYLEMPMGSQKSDTTITALLDGEREKGRPRKRRGLLTLLVHLAVPGKDDTRAACDWWTHPVTNAGGEHRLPFGGSLALNSALPHEAVRSWVHRFMSLGLSFPVCEMVGLGQMLIKWGPWQVIAYSERTKTFGLKRLPLLRELKAIFAYNNTYIHIIILQYDGNDVLLICVRVTVSFINHKWELHRHSHSLVFPVGNQLLTQFDILHNKQNQRGHCASALPWLKEREGALIQPPHLLPLWSLKNPHLCRFHPESSYSELNSFFKG